MGYMPANDWIKTMGDDFEQIKKQANRAFFKLCIIVIIAFVAVDHLAKLIPDKKEACTRTCSALGKRGDLVPVYTAIQTAGMGSRGPTECRCKP